MIGRHPGTWQKCPTAALNATKSTLLITIAHRASRLMVTACTSPATALEVSVATISMFLADTTSAMISAGRRRKRYLRQCPPARRDLWYRKLGPRSQQSIFRPTTGDQQRWIGNVPCLEPAGNFRRVGSVGLNTRQHLGSVVHACELGRLHQHCSTRCRPGAFVRRDDSVFPVRSP